MINKIVRLLIITAGLLLIPIIADQFVEGWNWTGIDYVFAGVMFFGTASLFELGRSFSENLMYRLGFGLALIGGFALIWGTLAVGFIGPEDNPVNLIYLAVLALGFLSAIAVRFKPHGMMWTMFGIGLGVALIPVIALIIKSTFQEIPEAAGVVQIFALNMCFVVLFIGSGLLFRNASLTANETSF